MSLAQVLGTRRRSVCGLEMSSSHRENFLISFPRKEERPLACRWNPRKGGPRFRLSGASFDGLSGHIKLYLGRLVIRYGCQGGNERNVLLSAHVLLHTVNTRSLETVREREGQSVCCVCTPPSCREVEREDRSLVCW